MITTRTGFEEAIRNKMPQRAMVTFPALPVVFTNDDIAVNGGIKIEETLNGSEDIEFGRAVESMASVTLINSDSVLSSVDFTGEFSVFLGVMLTEGNSYGSVTTSGATLAILAGSDTNPVRIETSTSLSSVYVNGRAYASGGSAKSLVMADDKLYIIGDGGRILRAYSVNGTSLTAATAPTLSAFMLNKASKWANENKCVYLGSDGTMRESRVINGRIEYDLWQYVPLGHFIGNKPDKVKEQIVSLSGYDFMQKFEVSAAGYFDTLSYPATLGALFQRLCAYCGVASGDTSAALNFNKTFSQAPINNDTSTCRDVLAYIAEAAGCYARMSRDGACELVWFEATNKSIWRTDYFSIDAAEYEVSVIDKLQSHVTSDDVGVIVGTGVNGYDIVDNPYLNESTDEAARPWIEPIYTRLNSFGAYSPVVIDAEGDWSIECGDIVSVVLKDGTSRRVPVFAQEIYWSGNAKATLMNSGNQTRGVMTASNRERLVNGRNYFELIKTVEGLQLNISSIKIGSRNLIRNSADLIFEDYYFTGQLVVTHDGAGNVTVVSGASAFVGEDGHVTIKTAASVSHDGVGNVTIGDSASSASFEVNDDGSVTLNGVSFVEQADGSVLLENATFTEQDDGSTLIQ